MTRKCDLTGKLVVTGNNVSHANNKTRRRFIPNLQNVSLYSDKLGKKLKFRIATSTLRTVEKNGGIDSFLLNAFSENLSSNAKKYKKSISKLAYCQLSQSKSFGMVFDYFGSHFDNKFTYNCGNYMSDDFPLYI